ncbi:MAG: thioredoxin family protein [Gemmatales bacterium]|nr:MAG: thioredoxin family protein [Gemmatales bacterium]
MKPRSAHFVCSALIVTFVNLSVSPGVVAEETLTKARLGRTIANVSFVDRSGENVHLYDLKGQAVVVVFLSFECPVSNSYSQALNRLAKSYGDKGVVFLGVTTNEDETAADVARHAKEFDLRFPIVKDQAFAAADAFAARITPEAFVLDKRFVLRYRGRIDDSYYARLKKKQAVTHHDLENALKAVLAGKEVPRPATEAIGCPIFRPEKNRPQKTDVTYYRDVLPILQKHCQTCHRPGEVGPFSLMTYRQAVTWAEDIKSYTESRQMPPWKPADGLEFHNDRRLTKAEIDLLAAWVDGGTPAGNPEDAPPPRKFAEGWHLGKPDLVLEMPAAFTVGPDGNDIFRCFVLPTNLDEDKYVTAVEIRPGNPRVVHHALLFIDTSGAARSREAAEQRGRQQDENANEVFDSGPGYSATMGIGFFPKGTLSGWAPGQVPRHLPDGTGYFLPKGSDVVMQVHYHRTGRIEKDRTRIGLYFAKKPVSQRVWGLVIPGRFLFIPAGDHHYRVTGSMWVQQDCQLHFVTPHMHLLGKSIKVTMVPEDGVPQTLIDIPEWDYNWQETYFFKKPIPVKKGTRFDVEAYYDNSASNPNNPFIPPRPVFIGRETTNEMCFGFLGATSDQPGRIRFRVGSTPAAD